jgi:site-specific DNA recombinase
MIMGNSVQRSGPKNGEFYKAVGVGRISTLHQDGRSLDDQAALYREWMLQNYGENFEMSLIQGTGSGEDLTRPELLELWDRVDEGDIDVVVTEDLGRISRRIEASRFCEVAEDTSTRVVAINDHVDTADPNWRMSSMFASLRHETYNRDTSSRIRRTLRNRFTQGDVVQSLPYGYVKPRARASDQECSKLPEAEHIYDEVFRRLEDGQTFAQVADWLNWEGIPTGVACKARTWSGTLLATVVRNPILKGVRQRNRRQTIRINRTGKHRTQPAPAEMLLERYVPHLAFIEAERYDRVIRLLAERGKKYQRADSVRNDPRAGIPKKQTRWPGQQLRCGVCGRQFVWGGHGRKDRLMCNGARGHQCWNSMTVDGPALARTTADEVRKQIEMLPDFDVTWIQKLQEETTELSGRNDGQVRELETELSKVELEVKNLVDFICSGAQKSESVATRLLSAEKRQAEIQDAIDALKRQRPREVNLPSMVELRRVARESFADLSVESREFSELIRKVVDDFYVLPFQLIGGGHPQPICTFKLNLSTLLAGSDPQVLRQIRCLNINGIVDLTSAPQYERIRNEVVRMQKEGMLQRAIAAQLNVTQPAVQHAIALQKKMEVTGLKSPWIPVLTDDAVRKTFKRISHARYQFQPLPGFERPKSIAPTEVKDSKKGDEPN